MHPIIKKNFAALLCLFLLKFTYAQIPNIPGDFPDPTVIKVGDTYYATATSSNWMPAHPILKSKDLKNWQWAANIFTKLPDWAEHYFWAPEWEYENGKMYVYYTAKRRGGALAVAVASADKPEGPYKDHGILVEQPMGSIDGFSMRDENGKLYLVWKEDGNSQRKPTIMFMQEMNEDRTKLLGSPKEMFRDTEGWERNLVEGASILKHNNYFYTIYAAAACCGSGCTYATGVARSKSLHGPWEKYSKNPLLTEEGDWRCQGHGTAFKDGDKYYFLYHGYHKKDGVYTGRQGLLKEFTFTPDGWIAFKDGFIYSDENYSQKINFTDKFNGKKLAPSWNWSVFNQTTAKQHGGNIQLLITKDDEPFFLAQKTYTSNYDVFATIKDNKSGAWAGIAIIGDDKNFVAVRVKGRSIQLTSKRNGERSIKVFSQGIGTGKKVKLKISVKNSTQISFYCATKKGDYVLLGTENAEGLPPWDRALRAGLYAYGVKNQSAVFEDFTLISMK